MELKKVNAIASKGYAKKDKISKKEVKKYTPTKWIVASATGLVTLLYTSPKNSIHRIGIVFGCISESQETDGISNVFWNITNGIKDVFFYTSWILTTVLILLFGKYMIHTINRNRNGEEEKKFKTLKNIKKVEVFLFVCIIITIVFDIFLE